MARVYRRKKIHYSYFRKVAYGTRMIDPSFTEPWIKTSRTGALNALSSDVTTEFAVTPTTTVIQILPDPWSKT